MTFVALTKLQNREPTLLQTVINNTGGKLDIALREFHYEVGYRNIVLPVDLSLNLG